MVKSALKSAFFGVDKGPPTGLGAGACIEAY